MNSRHIYQLSLLLLLTTSCHKKELYHQVPKSVISTSPLYNVYDDTESDVDYVVGYIRNKKLEGLKKFLNSLDDVAEIINVRDSNRELPLEIALEVPEEIGKQIALYLIGLGANVSLNDKYGLPLVNKAFLYHYEVAEKMMSMGAKIDLGKFRVSPCLEYIKTSQQQSEEVLVVIDRKFKKLNLQQKEVLVNLIDPISGVSPLCYCVAMGDTKMAKGLIDRGANVNGRNEVEAQDFPDYTPFMIAAERKDEAMMRLLFKRGADVNKATSSATKKYSALHKAVLSKDIEKVRMIIKVCGERIDLNVKDNRGKTPIMCAVDLNFEEAVRYLTDLNRLKEDNPFMDAIANVHVVDNFQCNLLHYAVGNLKLIRYCKEKLGVASSQKDRIGITPLNIALRNEGQEEVAYLLNNFSKEEAQRLYDYKNWCLVQSDDPKFPLMKVLIG